MNATRRWINGLLLAATTLTAIAMLAPTVSGQETVKESFTGFAINLNSGPSTATVDFTITRWSTDDERQRLLVLIKPERDALKANEQLQKELQKLPKVGYIKTPTTLAWDLHYARQSPLENGGRRVVLATHPRGGAARELCQGNRPQR